VALRDHLAHQRRVARSALGDAEEAGARAGARQQLQHARRDLRIRPVVEGQRDFAARGGDSGQTRAVRAEQARARQQPAREDR
jgi:hypothetical protein